VSVGEEREVEENGGEEREGKEMDGCPLTWSLVYISDTTCPRMDTANDTPHTRITTATLIQGACADLASISTTTGVP
jgi:hypothetical protein